MEDAGEHGVSYIKKSHEARITFGSVAHNSLTSFALKTLVKCFAKASEDNDVKIVILRSDEGSTFCAGANFDELVSIKGHNEAIAFFQNFGNLISAIRKCKKIVVCLVQGKAIGGGVGIVSVCDYAIASQSASIRLSELAIGIGPFVIGPAVERKIGLAAFGNLALNPTEWQTAVWGKEKGLYQEVFSSDKQCVEYLDHFVEKYGKFSLEAIIDLKKMLWYNTPDWSSLIADRAITSGSLLLRDDCQQALSASLDRKA